MKKGETVYFWWSCSYVYSVKFVDWKIVRTNDGYGVGALVESDWLFDKVVIPKIPHGCKRGQSVLAPHTDLYRSYNTAYLRNGKVRRPTVEQLRGTS